MGIIQCYGDVLGLGGAFYHVSGRVGQPFLSLVPFVVDTVSVCDAHVTVRRAFRQQMQTGADGVEAGVGGVFDEDCIRRFGENDVTVPVVSPVIHPCGDVGSVDFLEILWGTHCVGDPVVGVFRVFALMRAKGSTDGQPCDFHARRSGIGSDYSVKRNDLAGG